MLNVQFDLLDQWTQFLISDSLIPDHQLSTDDFAGHLENQTNLAIKGIVGIGAMAEIAKLLGDEDKANNYSVRVLSLLGLEGARKDLALNNFADLPSSQLPRTT